jgi:hypothetical protein
MASRRSRQPLESVDLDGSVTLLLVSPKVMLVKDFDGVGLGGGEMGGVEDDAVRSSTELLPESEASWSDRLTRSSASSSRSSTRSSTPSARGSPVTTLHDESRALPSTRRPSNLRRELDSVAGGNRSTDCSSSSKRSLHLQRLIPSGVIVVGVGEGFAKRGRALPLLRARSFGASFDGRRTDGTSGHRSGRRLGRC